MARLQASEEIRNYSGRILQNRCQCPKLDIFEADVVTFCRREEKTAHQVAVVIRPMSNVWCCSRNAVPTLLGHPTGTARSTPAFRSRRRGEKVN